MMHRTAVSSHMVPLRTRLAESISSRLHMAHRAVKCIGAPQNAAFQCPRDGSEMSLHMSGSNTHIRMTSSNECQRPQAHVSIAKMARETTVLGIRNGALFLRCRGPTEICMDVQQNDMFAVVANLTTAQMDAAIESLLCSSLSREAEEIEATAEQMLVDANAEQGGLAMLTTLGTTNSSEPQPPEYFRFRSC